MKINWKMGAMIVSVSIITPIIIGWGVSQDILNDWTNDNDWIGFWGSYVGTIIGSGVTLLVLWSTLEDNRRAREREEKINYYNNLIEVMATFTADAGNYLAAIKRLLNEQDNNVRNLCNQAANQVAKSSDILDAQLYIKGDIKNIDKIIRYIKPLEDEMDKIGDDIIELKREDFSNRDLMNTFRKRIDNVLNEINTFMKIFPEIVREELEK